MSELAFLPDLAAAGAAGLADLALKGLVVLLAGWVLAWALRRSPASARHLAWAAVFAALPALPLLATALPAWRAPLLPQAWNVAAAAREAPRPRPQVVTTLPRPSLPGRPVLVEPMAFPAPAPTPAAPLDAAAVLASLGGGRMLVVLAWLAGVELALLSLLLSALRLRGMERRARPASGGHAAALLPWLMTRAGVRGPVLLLEGDEATVPLTWGVRRPRILLPAAHREWPADRVEAVLLHELAHVRRHDALTQRLATVACALHWFNPLAWLALGRLRLEAEHACDDRVLAGGTAPQDYAGHLLDVARALSARPVSSAAVAMARPSQLRTRLLAVLSSERRRGGVPPAAALGALAGAALVAVPLATLTPFAGSGRQARETQVVTTTRVVSVDTVRVVDGVLVDVAPATEVLVTTIPTADVATMTRVERAVTVSVDTVVVPRATTVEVQASADPLATTIDAATAAMARATPAPVLAASPSPCGATPVTSRRDETDGRSWNVAWRRGACAGSARITGRVAFDPAGADVAAVAPGGMLRLEMRSAWGTGRVEVRRGRDGAPERRWWRDGRPQAWGPEARAWLAAALPELLRQTQYDEEQRG